ncbi:very-long-chain aldehyde decarbonylase CER1 isoform X1 [Rhodamnia argentea]|uniref:Very-long-chain aldehyde decarbonylase CER1 isoform X1 n=1 Tax=Rhodamnia argentea TaxID=178133 RepID=A0A8B8N4R0_9MYRT|nr:very-long-chain aldehyde decarbonylase CER1 isoform X1 [Rhodamnia argentea]
MASKPGLLTEWPWKPLGSFKYAILAPWAAHSTYQFMAKGPDERDLGYFLAFPFLLARMLHNQIWISLARHRTAKGNNRIVDRGIEFEQVDRESNWDDQILFNGILFYVGLVTIPEASHLPLWRTDGVIATVLIHTLAVEFLYYWLHRALHHHFLYSRYHSHHHSSIVTEPITSVIHPFAEHMAYFVLFAIPLLTTLITRTASIASFAGYVTYIDFMNNMGHCNFELIPNWLFTIFPPLKYLMYTPSFHSLHHTQFRTNYSLFMPIYDYIYGTMDRSTDATYETSLRRAEDLPDVVHLTHLTTPESVYHLRLGFASLASRPHSPKWYLRMLWPVTLASAAWTWIYGHSFILERNSFKKLKLQSWVIPRYNVQYLLEWRREAINGLIEEAILDANQKGVKVLTLGLFNQGEELNRNGELYIQKHRDLRTKLVDGSSLAVAVVLHSIPQGTSQVLLRGNLNKLAYAIAHALCARGIQVNVASKDEHEKLKGSLNGKYRGNLILSATYSQKIWLVGDGLAEEEQKRAPKGTLFIPFSQFPPKQIRRDCLYHSTPAMITPRSFDNLHSCENWLPRRVMSAWRVAGIVHALEGWNLNECGSMMLDIEKAWEASLRHGFRPLVISAV